MRAWIGLAFVALLLAIVAGSAEAQGHPLSALRGAPPDHASARGPPAHVALPDAARLVRDAGAPLDVPPARDVADAAPPDSALPPSQRRLPAPGAVADAAPALPDAGEPIATARDVEAPPAAPPTIDSLPEPRAPVAAVPLENHSLPPVTHERTTLAPARHTDDASASHEAPPELPPEVVDALLSDVPDESAAGSTSPLAMPLVTPLVRVLPMVALVGAASLALAVRMRAPSPLVRVQRGRRMSRVGDDAHAALRHGHAAIERDDLAEALAWFDHPSRAQPRLAIAHFCRGIALGGLGRTPEAHDALAEAVEHAPHEWSYRVHYARFAVALGKTTEAMDALGPVARALPEMHEPMLEDPQLAALRDHPRFLAMLGRL